MAEDTGCRLGWARGGEREREREREHSVEIEEPGYTNPGPDTFENFGARYRCFSRNCLGSEQVRPPVIVVLLSTFASFTSVTYHLSHDRVDISTKISIGSNLRYFSIDRSKEVFASESLSRRLNFLGSRVETRVDPTVDTSIRRATTQIPMVSRVQTWRKKASGVATVSEIPTFTLFSRGWSSSSLLYKLP